MKKAISFLLIAILLFSFSSCSSKTKGIKVYKPGEEVEDDNNANQNDGDNLGGSKKTRLNAFDGLDITVTGISPFCDVSINTSGCSVDVQNNVKFTTDKEKYANGEKVIITAEAKSTKDTQFVLIQKTKEFDVSGMPEYITSVEGLDLAALTKERDDFVAAQCGSSISDVYAFGKWIAGNSPITKIDSTTIKDAYMVSLKANKLATFNTSNAYNRICFLYHIVYENEKGQINQYVNIYANNIVKYPDGTIKWGTKTIDGFDFQYDVSSQSIEDITATSITSLSADYDITKITLN